MDLAVGAVDLLMVAVFAVMVVALAADRASARPRAPVAATPTLPPPPAGSSALSTPDALGWALVSPGGQVVATNLPEQAALLAGACAVLQQSGDPTGAQPWRRITLEGAADLLLGEISPHGAVLAVLARRGADTAALRAAMGRALAEVDVQAYAPSAVPPESRVGPTDPLLPNSGQHAASDGVPGPYLPLD